MKRFFVFFGHVYYPSGGWDDFAGDADTLDEAMALARQKAVDSDSVRIWWHIFDSTEKKIVMYDFQDPERRS